MTCGETALVLISLTCSRKGSAYFEDQVRESNTTLKSTSIEEVTLLSTRSVHSPWIDVRLRSTTPLFTSLPIRALYLFWDLYCHELSEVNRWNTRDKIKRYFHQVSFHSPAIKSVEKFLISSLSFCIKKQKYGFYCFVVLCIYSTER